MKNTKRTLLWIGCLATVCGIWITFCFQISHDRDQAQIAAETNAANLAKAFEEHVISTVQQIDTALLMLRHNYLEHPDQFLEQLDIYKYHSQNNLIIQASVIDVHGKLVFSDQPMPKAPLDLSDRAHFRAHLDTNEDKLHISKPVFGRVSHKWSIQFTRKIFRQDGTFGGVMVLSIDPEFFSSFFRSVDLGKNGVVTLVGSDRVIRARSIVEKYRPEAKGNTLPADRPLFDTGKTATGVYHLPSATDGVDRIWAYRRIQRYPLIVTVGLAVDEAFTQVDSRRNHLLLWGVIVSVLLLTGARIISWLDQKQQQTERNLREANQRLELATASSQLGIWERNLSTGKLIWNDRMFDMYGIDPRSFLGRVEDFQKSLHPDDLARVQEAIKAAIKGEKDYAEEFRVVKPDGTVRRIKASGLVIRDANGKAVSMIGLNSDITERKQMEDKLRQANHEWRRTFDSIPDMITIVDNNHRIVRANRAALQKLGCESEALHGKPCYTLFHGLDSPPEFCPHAVLMRTGHECSEVVFEPRLNCYLDVTVSPLYEPDGNIIGSIHVAHDITDLKRAEEALRDSETLYRSILTASPDNITITDMEGHILMYSPVTLTMFKCSQNTEEHLGRLVTDFIAPEDLARAEHNAVLMLKGNRLGPQEYLGLRQDGTTFDIEVNTEFIRDAEGRPVKMIYIVRDITDRKQVQIRLEQSLSLLCATLESTADGIIVVDKNGNIASYNQKFQEMWDIPESVLQTGADDQASVHVLDKLVDPDAFNFEVNFLYEQPDAESFDVIEVLDGRVFERYSQPQRIDNRIVGRVWSFRDITERKQAEEELKKKNVEIEQFIYTVSHDLRSPLVTVKTFLGFLEKDLAEGNQEQLAQDLQFIHNAADKMKLLLDELLEMSRIGRVETPPVRVSLKEVMTETLDTLAGVINERNVEIHLPDTDLILFGDRPRLCQLWQNLIENAIKYSRDNSIPRIELGIQRMSGETVFFVKDNGIGIDPKYHNKIFGIFDKLDAKSPGAGLGLSMVQRIVEKCGGRIWVESEGNDKGSCFLFTLPHLTVNTDQYQVGEITAPPFFMKSQLDSPSPAAISARSGQDNR